MYKRLITATLVLAMGTGCAKSIVRPSVSAIAMKNIAATVEIDASSEDVWEVVGVRFTENAAFEPSTIESMPLNRVVGVGQQRRAVGTNGKTIDVEVTEWNDGSTIAWEIMASEVGLIRAGVGQYTLESMGSGRTRVRMDAQFKTISGMMDGVAKGKFTNLFQQNLAALKHFIETKERTEAHQAKAIADRYRSSIQTL